MHTIRKLTMLLVMSVMLSIVLSGCVETNQSNEENIDSDNDGYPDIEDDFPNDSNLYLLSIISKGYQEIGVNLPPYGTSGNTIVFRDTIESDCKYIECKWNITPDNSSIRDYLYFIILTPTDNKEFTGKELYGKHTYRETIDFSNAGEWEINFVYKGGVSGTPNYLPDHIKVTYDIYKVK